MQSRSGIVTPAAESPLSYFRSFECLAVRLTSLIVCSMLLGLLLRLNTISWPGILFLVSLAWSFDLYLIVGFYRLWVIEQKPTVAPDRLDWQMRQRVIQLSLAWPLWQAEYRNAE